jgi:hypothetical protein
MLSSSSSLSSSKMILRRFSSSSSSLPSSPPPSSSSRRVLKRISYVKILKPSPSSSSTPVSASPSIAQRITQQILDRPFRAAFFIVGLGFFTASMMNRSRNLSLNDLNNTTLDGDLLKGNKLTSSLQSSSLPSL